jgi:peptidoglycan/xylan/chitin deacetylase (PgdA/CDA1 family)
MYPLAKGLDAHGIPILVYHGIDSKRMTPYAISPGKFMRQMQCLRIAGYGTTKIKDILAFVEGKNRKRVPKKILLTFDDGYRDFIKWGLPVLKENDFSALVSVVTECCDLADLGGGCSRFRSPTMSWREVKEIQRAGVEIASHGVTHERLTEISQADKKREIKESKRKIEEKLGEPICTFCYPYGAFDEDAAGTVRQCGYRIGLTTEAGLVKKNDDAATLKRITIDDDLSLIEFKAMITPAAEWYYRLRGVIVGE